MFQNKKEFNIKINTKKLLVALISFLILNFNLSLGHFINEYFVLNKGHDLFKVIPKLGWWYIPKYDYKNPGIIENNFKYDGFFYMKKFYDKMGLKYGYIDGKKKNVQYYIQFDNPLIMKNYMLIRKYLPDIFFSYRKPQTDIIKWIQGREVTKYILGGHGSKKNQILILYPIKNKFTGKTQAFLQAPCGNMTCYDKNNCLPTLKYSLTCKIDTLDSRNTYYDFENIKYQIKVYLNGKELSLKNLNKLKIKKIHTNINNKNYNLKEVNLGKLKIGNYQINGNIQDPFTWGTINCEGKNIKIIHKNNSCNFKIKGNTKFYKGDKINLLNYYSQNGNFKILGIFYKIIKEGKYNSKWKMMKIKNYKNFKLNEEFSKYKFAIIGLDQNYNKRKLCGFGTVYVTGDPYCKISGINSCYNYGDKIYPNVIVGKDSFLEKYVLNNDYKFLNIKFNESGIYKNKDGIKLINPGKNYISFYINNQYNKNKTNFCKASFIVNPKLYCGDGITSKEIGEECDYKNPKDGLFCDNNCKIKKINSCEIKGLNYSFNGEDYTFYINKDNLSKIILIKFGNNYISNQDYLNKNLFKLKINGIIGNKIKIIAKIGNKLIKNDIKICEKDIIIKKKPIGKYCNK